ncbi:hypothetical protein GMST_06710 [Geomonas silvestris]|uniref:Uncharacterized protein n=1 Tax=Geomonas silvestris TaxID=2740184 RepID=A0A6V8MED0_9BACT|nr:hypothetical protein [Geomonas silvestris]GFO58346.1 hypothetical protein GMST_06710 [Geomonas silvestris]
MSQIIVETVETNMAGLAPVEVVVRLRLHADKVDHHRAFQGQFGPYVSNSGKLREICDAVVAALDAAEREGNKKIDNHPMVLAGKQALAMNAHHVNMMVTYHNDPSYADDCGLELKAKPQVKVAPSLIDLLPVVSAKNAGEETIDVIIKRDRASAVVELWISDEPKVEAGASAGLYQRSRIQLKKLQSAKRIYIFARYHEDGHAGKWTAPIPIVVT